MIEFKVKVFAPLFGEGGYKREVYCVVDETALNIVIMGLYYQGTYEIISQIPIE